MNSWTMTAKSNNKRITKKGIVEDKFKSLVPPQGEPSATVSMTVGESLDYGALKVSATVTIQCCQIEDQINKAGELVFDKACELVKDGFAALGAEQNG